MSFTPIMPQRGQPDTVRLAVSLSARADKRVPWLTVTIGATVADLCGWAEGHSLVFLWGRDEDRGRLLLIHAGDRSPTGHDPHRGAPRAKLCQPSAWAFTVRTKFLPEYLRREILPATVAAHEVRNAQDPDKPSELLVIVPGDFLAGGAA